MILSNIKKFSIALCNNRKFLVILGIYINVYYIIIFIFGKQGFLDSKFLFSANTTHFSIPFEEMF